ncbi:MULTISPECIES: TIGR03279 family radical SAM protein [Prochlorococcus]|uniref:Putative Fe-S oxidoreductase n=1 Tax=Prochlorococcus marinus str. MIT 9116 TaxID=167544 RepID=A0A0A1ZPD5_PROMR|nr:TIGR03279 family radical SAM protein [Prochlorococcus marinus]KGF89313.1 putative Fe-S oxidoreductase [Prochlorococcus marinus str. MIT 9107]KGF90069.1 putative Fe-S oxidoreductase [Prochlorococcus marinus str. MIT 9116]KGF95505.1 putative Fe-S oxidoreductase [Prochlorococcus marinus str. MIT 9123]
MWQEINYKENSNDILVPNITYKINPAEIESIEANSIAQEIGFESGDSIISINGKKPRDLIDYQILISEEVLNISVLDKNDEIHNISIEKDQDVNLGINFKNALFDSIKQCNNKCPFCFIDQQPSGKRKSLYLKDDDYRLSFLYGSYLTLTNLKKEDWERISTQKLSPLFISVHATDPDTREKLLNNKKAGVILDQISWFEKNSIQIHAQIVVCPNINDGEILEKSIFELAKFYKKNSQTVLSVAIVPVGLTKFRPENDGLKSISSEYAKKIIKQVEMIQDSLQITLGTRFCWLADEWYLIAGKILPSYNTYENMPQESNGVGSIRSFLKTLSEKSKNLPQKVKKPKKVSWIVGKLVYEALIPIVKKLNLIDGLTINLYGLASIYWGQEQVVTGLLTGEDLIFGLQNKDLGEAIYIPSIMLKINTDLFLDDKNIKEVENQLNTQIHVLDDSNDIIDTLIGKSNKKIL